MQPRWHSWRSWNWRRLIKKARGGLVALLATLPLLLFICLVYLLMIFERLFNRRKFVHSNASRGLVDESGALPGNSTIVGSHHSHLLTRHRQQAERHEAGSEPTAEQSESLAEQRAMAEAAERAREESGRIIAANLKLCVSPASVIAVAEEAAHRGELGWASREKTFERLIDVSATPNDVSELMRLCGFEWLFRKKITPRRFIRLKTSPETGAMSWQQLATGLICYEFDGGGSGQQVPPVFDELYSLTRIFFYFDRSDQVVGWERPLEMQRGNLLSK